jgi:hypothetical protein
MITRDILLISGNSEVGPGGGADLDLRADLVVVLETGMAPETGGVRCLGACTVVGGGRAGNTMA